MTCPLTLLRQYNVNRREIIERDDYIFFGEYSWPKTAKTNYLMYGSNKDGATKSYYTLGCMMYLLKNSRLPHSMYVRQAMTEKVPIVRRPDRKDMLAYLNGITATSLAIDKLAPLEPPAKPKRQAESSLDNDAAKKPRLLMDKLDSQAEVTVLIDNIKSLSDTMSVERIAAIKAKRMAKKRTTIKGHDDIFEADTVMEAMIQVDSDATKSILARERVLRTRVNVLQSVSKDFQRSVFGILRSVAAKERSEEAEDGDKPETLPLKELQPQAKPTAYNRYDQQRFVQQREAAEGFVIDTRRTYHGQTLQSVTEGCAKSASLPGPADSAIAAASQSTPLAKKRVSRTPIIVVPSSETSLITTHNASDILQDMRFKTSQEAKTRNGGRRENELLLQRRKDGNLTVPYLVVDNPLRLNKDDWDRVVAVFVVGPQWQFKGWPFAGNPVEIFARIPAFHFKYDEMPVDANVARWAVKIIEISRTRRHLDRAAIIKFWEELDKFMVTNKQHLRF